MAYVNNKNNQLDNLLLKIGVMRSSATDKHAFCAMYNYVVEPPHPLTPPKRSPRRAQCDGGPGSNPAIMAFRTVFKDHFRRHPFIHFAKATEEADAEFRESLYKYLTTTTGSNDDLLTPVWSVMEEDIQSQMRVELGWLEKVNAWRRLKFYKLAREEGIRKFRRQLHERYPFGTGNNGGQFYEEAGLTTYLADLKTGILAEFVAEKIPAFEQENNRGAQGWWWRLELGLEIDTVAAEALEVNRRNREEQWKQKTGRALIQYKKEMESFLRKRQFASKEVVNGFHVATKGKCEVAHGLTQLLNQVPPVLKAEWEHKIGDKFRVIKGQKKAMADGRIRKFLRTTLKAQTGRMIGKKFGCELEEDEVDSLFSPNVAAVLRRKLERADETKFAGAERASDSESENDGDSEGTKSDNSDNNDSSTSGDGEVSSSEESSDRRGKSSESEGDDDSDSSSSGGGGDGVDPGREYELRHGSNPVTKYTLAPIGVQYDTREDPSRYDIIIPKNTKLPTSTFLDRGKTKLSNQTVAEVCLWEGDRPAAAAAAESSSSSSSKRLGKVYLTDLRPGKRGFEKLDLKLKVDATGILHAKYEAKRSKIKEYFKFKTSAWQGSADDDL